MGRISDEFPGKDVQIMYELQKFKLGIKNTFEQYLNCAPLNEKTLRGLINQSLSKKGRMIIRNIMTMKIYVNELTKQMKFQEHSRIKDSVEKYA